ncbi:MAG: hypothetical protein LBM87_01385 [Ruminococcus sp.]|jgi:hypothetical protein|nr:hypothetical protein [Ruminococcus sp.]
MKAAGAILLSLISAAAGAAMATYAIKKRNEIDKFDFEFDEDDFCDCDDCDIDIEVETPEKIVTVSDDTE